MSYTPPDPPTNIPPELLDRLDVASPEVLRDVASYADGLAEYKEREARLEEANDDSPSARDVTEEETPDDVPANATITIKEIKENRYYYWQWRDGEKIRSKYKGPVNQSE